MPEAGSGKTGGMENALEIGPPLLAAQRADLAELRLEAVFGVGGHGAEISAGHATDKVTSPKTLPGQHVTLKQGVVEGGVDARKEMCRQGLRRR